MISKGGRIKLEIWKDVEGYEGIYQISNLGNVKSLNRIVVNINGAKRFIPEKLLKVSIRKDNSVTINLNKDGIKKTRYIARVVYKAFNPEFDYFDTNLIVLHKDEDFKNNKLDNLYILTRKEFIESKHTRKIICVTTDKKFNSILEASKYYNISSGHICKCCSGEYSYAGSLSKDIRLVFKYCN